MLNYQEKTLKLITIIVGLIAISILLLAALKTDFRGDDFAHLSDIKFNVMPDPLQTIFGTAQFSGHYRPMARVFFGLGYVIFGTNPLGYSLVLISIFLLNLYLFFWLTKTLTNSVLSGYAAVLLFFLQGNIYLYTVNWIGADTNVIAGFLMILTFVCYVKSLMSRRQTKFYYYLLALLSFMIGLLTREIVVVLLGLLLVYDFLFLWLEAPTKKQILIQRFFSQLPFWVIFAGYSIVRSLIPEAQSLSGQGPYYTFTLSSKILNNLIFFGMQLGFLPLVIIAFTLPGLLRRKWKLEPFYLKPIVFGVCWSAATVLPFLFFQWTSPTWTYVPAFGATLVGAILFERGLRFNSTRGRTLLVYGTLCFALLGNLFLFYTLNQARWWQWGEYSRNVIQAVKTDYPVLPTQSIIYFIDKNKQKPYGVENLFQKARLDDALQFWYDDPSLKAYIVNEADLIGREAPKNSALFVFEYDTGVVVNKTEWFRMLNK